MVDDALGYAALGWPIFPLAGKRPHPMLPAGGFHLATTDTQQIRDWWTRAPEANIGASTGELFAVLDVDHDDWRTGVADLPAMRIPASTPVVRTGSGWHAYLAPAGIGRRVRFSEHCDWLDGNGYTILPPSRHPNGALYRWHRLLLLPLPPIPAELLELLEPPRCTQPPAQRPHAPLVIARGAWSPAGLYRRMTAAVEGERNAVLHWCATRVFADLAEGRASPDEATEALHQLAHHAHRAGLATTEVDRTIASAGKTRTT